MNWFTSIIIAILVPFVASSKQKPNTQITSNHS